MVMELNAELYCFKVIQSKWEGTPWVEFVAVIWDNERGPSISGEEIKMHFSAYFNKKKMEVLICSAPVISAVEYLNSDIYAVGPKIH